MSRRSKRPTAYDHLQLGVIFYQSNSYDLAIEQFELARKKAPHAANVWNNLGVAYMDKGELDKAMSALQRALEITHSTLPVISTWASFMTSWGTMNRRENATRKSSNSTGMESLDDGLGNASKGSIRE